MEILRQCLTLGLASLALAVGEKISAAGLKVMKENQSTLREMGLAQLPIPGAEPAPSSISVSHGSKKCYQTSATSNAEPWDLFNTWKLPN